MGKIASRRQFGHGAVSGGCCSFKTHGSGDQPCFRHPPFGCVLCTARKRLRQRDVRRPPGLFGPGDCVSQRRPFLGCRSDAHIECRNFSTQPGQRIARVARQLPFARMIGFELLDLSGNRSDPCDYGNALGFDCCQPVARISGGIAFASSRDPRGRQLVGSTSAQCRRNALRFGCTMHGFVSGLRISARDIGSGGGITPPGINQAPFRSPDVIRQFVIALGRSGLPPQNRDPCFLLGNRFRHTRKISFGRF